MLVGLGKVSRISEILHFSSSSSFPSNSAILASLLIPATRSMVSWLIFWGTCVSFNPLYRVFRCCSELQIKDNKDILTTILLSCLTLYSSITSFFTSLDKLIVISLLLAFLYFSSSFGVKHFPLWILWESSFWFLLEKQLLVVCFGRKTHNYMARHCSSHYLLYPGSGQNQLGQPTGSKLHPANVHVLSKFFNSEYLFGLPSYQSIHNVVLKPVQNKIWWFELDSVASQL